MTSLDKLFVSTIHDILGTNIKIYKWSIFFTSIGVGINLFLNSFIFIKNDDENNIFQNKITLLLDENNIFMNENIQKINKKLDLIIDLEKASKNISQIVDHDNLLDNYIKI